MHDKSCLPVSLGLPALIIVVTVAVTGKMSAGDLVSVSVYLFLAQETRHCLSWSHTDSLAPHLVVDVQVNCNRFCRVAHATRARKPMTVVH